VWGSLRALLISIYKAGVFYFGKYSYKADNLKLYKALFEIVCRFRTTLFYIWIWPYLKREGYAPLWIYFHYILPVMLGYFYLNIELQKLKNADNELIV